MGDSRSLGFVLMSTLLLLSFAHGFEKKLEHTFVHEGDSKLLLEEKTGVSPEDYEDPGPNTNSRSGFIPPSSTGSTPRN